MAAEIKRTNSIPGGEWFTGAGFGMFVHWDHASAQGLEIGWPITGRSIIPGQLVAEDLVSPEQYHSSAPGFNPVLWSADDLADLAKNSGAQYVVFTTRHHGGYSMFHTAQSSYSIQNSPFKRDIVREVADAVRARGMRVGFYYSLSDWHHEDYPSFTEADRPYRKEHYPEADWPENEGTPIQIDRHRRPTPEQWSRYLDYVRGQISELLTNYGQVDLLWFDGGWERSPQEWDCAGIRELIKSLQPNCIINERLTNHGDYFTPEQSMPAYPPAGPWEMCMTVGEHWGWRPNSKTKSARSLVVTLIEVVSRGGNLLLNTGITGDGSLDPNQVECFEQIGDWMTSHSSSVIGVEPAFDVDFYGPVTRDASSIYLHLLSQPIERTIVRGLPVDRILGIELMSTEQPIPYTLNFEVHHRAKPGEPRTGEVQIEAPDPSGALVDVLRIRLS